MGDLKGSPNKLLYLAPDMSMPTTTTTWATSTEGPWTVSGPCEIVDGGSCIQSPNYPSTYQNREKCTIGVAPGTYISQIYFNTERRYDILTVDRTEHSGQGADTGLGSAFEATSIYWTSDRSQVKKGWK